MTFTEAAEDVLRSVKRPLHYKKIVQIAIERNLLSHVGKTPEITMSSRLAMMVKKDRGEAPVIRVRPGVFALREFPEDVMKLADDAENVEIAAVESPKESPPGRESSDKKAGSKESSPNDGKSVVAKGAAGEAESVSADSSDHAKKPQTEEEARFSSEGVFPEEDDDDDLIFDGLDSDSEGSPRRRRRRRPSRRPEEGAAEAADERDTANGEGSGRRTRGRSGRRTNESRGSEARNGDSRRRERSGSRKDSAPKASEGPAFTDREPEIGDAVGHDLAEAIFDALSSDRQIHSYRDVAEALVRKKKLSGSATALAATIAAAVRSDNARRCATGDRPRFWARPDSVGRWDCVLPRAATRTEGEVFRRAGQQRDMVRKEFLSRLQGLATGAQVELLATWLNAEGVFSLRAVRPPVELVNGLHFAGVLNRGHETIRMGIVYVRDGATIEQDLVVCLRGAAHHYDDASVLWVLTSGKVTPEARKEASLSSLAQCSLFDGIGLARAMESHGVGIQRHRAWLASLDVELLASLGADVFAAPGGTRDASRDNEDSRSETDEEGTRSERGGRRRRRSTRKPRTDEGASASDEGTPDVQGSSNAAAEEGTGADPASVNGSASEAKNTGTARNANGAEPTEGTSEERSEEQASPTAPTASPDDGLPPEL